MGEITYGHELKKLVVYYSLDGNTRFIAQTIAQTIRVDLLELKPKNQPKWSGFGKYFWGGRQVFMKEKPELLSFDKNPENYDVIFIGTPVWAFSYAPALATFFSLVHIKDKKIALFCCSGGGKGNTLEKMAAALPGNDVIGQTDFIEPAKRNREKNVIKAREWVQGLKVV